MEQQAEADSESDCSLPSLESRSATPPTPEEARIMPASTFVGGSIDMQVRFESMGGTARRAQVYRRHEDLRRAFEHQVKAFARETRHVTSKLSRIQAEHLLRMRDIERLEPATYREEWPSLEERREIMQQMQESPLPMLTGGAAASSHKKKPQGGATPSRSQQQQHHHHHGNTASKREKLQKMKALAPKMQNANVQSSSSSSSSKLENPKVLSPKSQNVTVVSAPQKAQSTRLKGVLSRPHWAHPNTQEPSQKLSAETPAVSGQAQENTPANGNPRSPPSNTASERTHPTITLSPSHHQGTAAESSLRTAQPASSQHKPPPTVVLHKPGGATVSHSLPVADVTAHRGGPRPPRPGRGRHPWSRHENVLLFRVEARGGKEKHMQIAQRKYPSMI